MSPRNLWLQATLIPLSLAATLSLTAQAQAPQSQPLPLAQSPDSTLVTNHAELTLAGAQQVMEAAIAAANQLNAPGGSIAVVDSGGQLIMLERLDNTFAASATVAYGKAHTAALFRKDTNAFETSINGGRTALLHAMPDFTPLQGGIPIELDGQVVGAIGVSGSASAQQDEDIAKAAAQAFGGGS